MVGSNRYKLINHTIGEWNSVCQVRFNINSWFFLEAFVPRLNIVLSNEIHPIGPRCTAGFPVEYQTSSYKGLLLWIPVLIGGDSQYESFHQLARKMVRHPIEPLQEEWARACLVSQHIQSVPAPLRTNPYWAPSFFLSAPQSGPTPLLGCPY